ALNLWSEACDGCRAEARKAYAVARGSTCRVLPPPERLLHRTVVLAAAPTPIAEKWFVATVAPEGVARKEDIVRTLARYEAALSLVAQHRDELGAIVGLAAQRLVRDDDRGSRQCRRRDAVKHILRDRDAVERAFGVVPIVDRNHGPAQARVVARHRGEYMRADPLFGIADLDWNLNCRIEHLAAIRHRLARGAPHVNPLRRAADVDRDR